MKYKVLDIRPRLNGETGEQDKHNNIPKWWIDLEDADGDEIKASSLLKNAPAKGEEVEGEVETKVINGRTYYDFRRAQKEYNGVPRGGGNVKDTASIERQVALKEAYNTLNAMITAGLIQPASTKDVTAQVDSLFKHNVELLKGE
jgi:hypothetical protein